MRRLLFAVPLLATGPAAFGFGTEKLDIDRVLSAAREEGQVMEHLDILANRIGPRLTSSDNLTNACEWTVGRFKEFGIDNARMEKWGEFPVGFNRGPWSGRMVEPTVKALTFGTNSWTAGTKGVVKGPVVIAPDDEEQLKLMKDKLPGAWVLVPPATRVPGGRQGQGGGGNDEFRRKLAAAYEEAKVAGVIRGTSNDRIVTGGSYQVSWDKLPTVPAINMKKADYDEVTALAKEGKPVVLEFDIRNYFKKGPIPLYNVIADIPGTEFPDEYVIIGGHIDSWDGATGTTDNGTGCATTLEAARILMKSGVKPRRTIRFMLWSGEEQGLLGSRAYVKDHPDLIKKISAVLVHDGGTNYLSGIGVTKSQLKDMQEALAPVLELSPEMPFAIREVAGLPRGIGSDHDTFLGAGAPGFFWGQKGKAVYNQTHHTQYDTYDRAVPEYQKHSSTIVALAALGVANLDHLLSRENMTAPGGGRGGPGGGGGRRRMGLMLEEMKVSEVVDGSPAQAAGFKPGDQLVKVNGKGVASMEEYSEILRDAGNEVKVTVKRDGQEVELTVKFPPPQP